MAQSKSTSKKTGTRAAKSTRSKSAAPKSTARAAAAMTPPEPAAPIRREAGGVFFLFLTLVITISYFKNEGAFVTFFSDIVKGYAGWGYWLSAPAFLLMSYILFFHRGRPVALRCFCAFMVPIFVAAIVSLFENPFDFSRADFFEIANLLFDYGKRLESAGVFGGLLAHGLESALSIYGALPVLIVLTLVCGVYACSGSMKKAADKVKIQVQGQYDPSMYENSLSPITAVTGGLGGKTRKIERVQRGAYDPDIPLGEDDDAMSLLEGKAGAHAIEKEEPKPRRKPPKITVVNEKPTADIAPLSTEEAAAIAGIDIKTFDEAKAASRPKKAEKPVSVKPTARGTTVSAEISDPPKQKLSRDELNAETQAVANAINTTEDAPDYVFPPVELLRSGTAATGDSREEILVNKERLEGALHSFGIPAAIVGVIRGQPSALRCRIKS